MEEYSLNIQRKEIKGEKSDRERESVCVCVDLRGSVVYLVEWKPIFHDPKNIVAVEVNVLYSCEL
jgi:hypothetical protein